MSCGPSPGKQKNVKEDMMKQFLKSICSIGWITVLLISALSFGGAYAANNAAGAVGPDSLNGQNWMAGIPDSRYISEINLPCFTDILISKLEFGFINTAP